MSQLPQLGDKELVQLLKSDDYAAFTEIYQRYGEMLAGFAGAKLYDLDDARDVLHDIFVRLWEDRHSLVITGNLKSYLFSAMRYRVVDKIRRNVTREDYAAMFIALEDSYSLEAILDAKEMAEQLDRSLTELPPRTRDIFRLSRYEHLTVLEIAQKLDISEQTVKNQITTALKHLRRLVPILFFFKFL